MEEEKKEVKKRRVWGVDVIMDFLRIYTWKETWIPVIAGLLVTTVWFAFTYALALPHPWRAIVIWVGILLGLLGQAYVRAQRAGKK